MLDGIGSNIGAYTPQPLGVAGPSAATQATKAFNQQKTAEVPSGVGAPVYYSPAIKIDRSASVAIYVQRDSESGQVIKQYPSKSVVEEYKKVSTQKAEDIRNFQQESADRIIAARAEVKAKPAEPKPEQRQEPAAVKAEPAPPPPTPKAEIQAPRQIEERA
jgi:hypothetical protein